MRKQGMSLIIIFHRRFQHLLRSLEGVQNGSAQPDEILLVEMDSAKSNIPEYQLNIKHILLEVSDCDCLPLSEARNLGACWSNYKTLAFLDVDCIPSRDYIATIARFPIAEDFLYMGKPRYMTQKVSVFNDVNLRLHSRLHPHRPTQDSVKTTNDYGMFWSLTFFLTHTTFSKIDGFDCGYSGYGAEDTDFAFKARKLDIGFVLTPFEVFHQQHAFCRPPLGSLKAIAKNCNHFYSKWNHWPMTNYLNDFAARGLIRWCEDQNYPIKLINEPSTQEIEKALVFDEPYA